ncbi:MAG: hypothetical protein ACTSUE_03645 [Promethearchaeota archaeon]
MSDNITYEEFDDNEFISTQYDLLLVDLEWTPSDIVLESTTDMDCSSSVGLMINGTTFMEDNVPFIQLTPTSCMLDFSLDEQWVPPYVGDFTLNLKLRELFVALGEYELTIKRTPVSDTNFFEVSYFEAIDPDPGFDPETMVPMTVNFTLSRIENTRPCCEHPPIVYLNSFNESDVLCEFEATQTEFGCPECNPYDQDYTFQIPADFRECAYTSVEQGYDTVFHFMFEILNNLTNTNCGLEEFNNKFMEDVFHNDTITVEGLPDGNVTGTIHQFDLVTAAQCEMMNPIATVESISHYHFVLEEVNLVNPTIMGGGVQILEEGCDEPIDATPPEEGFLQRCWWRIRRSNPVSVNVPKFEGDGNCTLKSTGDVKVTIASNHDFIVDTAMISQEFPIELIPETCAETCPQDTETVNHVGGFIAAGTGIAVIAGLASLAFCYRYTPSKGAAYLEEFDGDTRVKFEQSSEISNGNEQIATNVSNIHHQNATNILDSLDELFPSNPNPVHYRPQSRYRKGKDT